MSLTAVVTNHDYSRYLPRCLESAIAVCDEILVYDDGSTDDSLDVLARYPVKVTHRDDATGDPVWGSNQGIQDATSTHLLFLDADNYLLSCPPTLDVDYCFAPIDVVRDDERLRCRWEYPDWPLDAHACWDTFIAAVARGKYPMPFPWGGVWRTSFVKPLKWRPWDTTSFAADYRTALDWCKHSPTLAYHPTPFLAFRTHSGQWSESPERAVMQREVEQVASIESF